MEKKTIHIIATTTLVAILLWVSVTLSTEYPVAVSVPLVVEALPPNTAIVPPFPPAVILKLRGTGWRNAALLLGADPQCRIDVTSLSPSGRGLSMIDVVDRTSLPPGLQAVAMVPESLQVALGEAATKRVPVLFNADLAFRPGYGIVGSVGLSPESVAVAGAASELRDLTAWPTARTRFSDVKTTVEADIPLMDSASHYLSLSPSTVRVRIDVQQLAEKTISGLFVSVEGAPSNREVILIPPRVDLVVRGGVERLAAVSSEEFTAWISYDVVLADSSGLVEPRVSSPEGVQVVRKKPEHMQFVVRTRLR